MSLQNTTKEEYIELGKKLKELKRLNEEVKIKLSKVCGRNYPERVLPCKLDFDEIALTLEGKMNRDYPDSKAESMKIFF